MKLETYKKKYFTIFDSEFEKPDKSLAIQWLDEKIAIIEKIKELSKSYYCPLVWGKYKERSGEYDNEVKVIGLPYPLGDLICVTHGIDELADLVGEKLYEIRCGKKWEYKFIYKGYTVSQESKERFGNFCDVKKGMETIYGKSAKRRNH